ncbi:MAG TPA: hypothetical protein VMT69_13320 [Kineosporiaceae bacterium]|nr:hypothetical protein [Kineosporiaceae bacterium]
MSRIAGATPSTLISRMIETTWLGCPGTVSATDGCPPVADGVPVPFGAAGALAPEGPEGPAVAGTAPPTGARATLPAAHLAAHLAAGADEPADVAADAEVATPHSVAVAITRATPIRRRRRRPARLAAAALLTVDGP